MFHCPTTGARAMIIEVEDRFCKVAKAFSKVLDKLQRAAERGDAVHEVEETTWSGLIETGREMIVAYIKKQEEEFLGRKSSSTRGRSFTGCPSDVCGRMFRPSARRRFDATSTPRGKRNARRWCRWTRSSACRRAIRRICCRSGRGKGWQDLAATPCQSDILRIGFAVAELDEDGFFCRDVRWR